MRKSVRFGFLDGGDAMFSDWANFYLIVGSGGGALIGVMFVVTTLTAGLEESRASRGALIYITPIVFHFAVVLIVSAIAVTPGLPVEAVGVLIAIPALLGLLYSVVTAIRVFTIKIDDAPDWEDKIFYGIIPVIAYVLLACATAAIWIAPMNAELFIGAVMMLLLLIGIRNAWDLATYLVMRRPGSSEPR
jgi:hypothetical protein